MPSEKIDERGFFVAVLPDDAPDYALRIRYTEDTEPVIEEDPYHSVLRCKTWIPGCWPKVNTCVLMRL